MVRHRAHDPRVFHVLGQVHSDHGTVEGKHTAVVRRDQGRACFRHMLDPMAFNAKPVFVHKVEQHEAHHGRLDLHPERIVSQTEIVELQLPGDLIIYGGEPFCQPTNAPARFVLHDDRLLSCLIPSFHRHLALEECNEQNCVRSQCTTCMSSGFTEDLHPHVFFLLVHVIHGFVTGYDR